MPEQPDRDLSSTTLPGLSERLTTRPAEERPARRPRRDDLRAGHRLADRAAGRYDVSAR